MNIFGLAHLLPILPTCQGVTLSNNKTENTKRSLAQVVKTQNISAPTPPQKDGGFHHEKAEPQIFTSKE